MYAKVPVVGVVGHKNSGKTTVIERMVQELAKREYRVATAKHIPQKGFLIDTEGKDTWRHSVAGANPVVSVSDVETAVLMKEGEAQFSACMPEGQSVTLEKNLNLCNCICIENAKGSVRNRYSKPHAVYIHECPTQSI